MARLDRRIVPLWRKVLLEYYQNSCGICTKDISGLSKRGTPNSVVMFSKDTGHVLGLTCHSCATALGTLETYILRETVKGIEPWTALQRVVDFIQTPFPVEIISKMNSEIVNAELTVTREWRKVGYQKHGLTYIIRFRDVLKIGFIDTTNVKKLRNIPHEEIVVILLGRREQELRQMFKEHRVPIEGHSEWFYDNPEIRQYLDTQQDVKYDLEIAEATGQVLDEDYPVATLQHQE